MKHDIKVLDHGSVRLVETMGSDLAIVRSARVSYDAEWRAGEDKGSDARLINYLWSNGHTSPFESCAVTFQVKAPIFVLRQWHRHRTHSYNEVSARYTELPEEYYIPDPSLLGKQSKHNKQMRDIEPMTEQELKTAKAMCELMNYQNEQAFNAYRTLIKNEVPRELARSVLPVATYSKMFVSMNLLNLFRFLTLRCHEHAQYEIRVYAEAMLELIRDEFPEAVKAWEKTNGIAK